MLLKTFCGFLVAGLCASVTVGCSSSNNSSCPPGDVCTSVKDSGMGGSTTDRLVERFDDSAASSGSGGSTSTYDGTTGVACKVNADCQPDGGPGINVCSAEYGGSIINPVNVPSALFAGPVCMLPLPTSGGNCDPGNDATQIHFCDGPDDPTVAPGLCVPNDFTNPMTGQGICYPLCTFQTDGTAPKGCVAGDACLPVNFLLDPTTNTALGVGYCVSACQKNSDCSSALGTGFTCQTDIGYCTKTPDTRTKAAGALCTTADNTSGACLCSSGAGTNGYCSALCVTGGNPCPNGWVCDSGEPPSLDFGAGEPTITLSKQNPSLVGVCAPGCTPSGDAGSTGSSDAAESDAEPAQEAAASAACPMYSSCIADTVAGPDCEFQ